jgi:aconitate hydratase|tara:strand:+ start:872 stop:3160 length:2289 start_codon:yes stop_codon:yes gene_type:complete
MTSETSLFINVNSTSQLVNSVYEKMRSNITKFRNSNSKPLTLTEKIILGHISDIDNHLTNLDSNYVRLKPDRVALQDVTGQMTILQFLQTGLDVTKIPTTLHCDHLIRAEVEGKTDMKNSLTENNEVYKFLESASKKLGIGFWKPGAGIIHQIVLENYAFPGGFIIGTDSHTPNCGGLGMIGIGVGGLDAAEVMGGLEFEVVNPKRIGIYLSGKLNGWTSPKDIILFIASKLGVSGATNSVLEYFGPGTSSISCTGKATITNMGAELGATSSVFPYDSRMEQYLITTNRNDLSALANDNLDLLCVDKEIESNPAKYFDNLVEINLDELEPHIVGPHRPDLGRPISKFAEEISEKGYVDDISVALIGSCTNSSYEDMDKASSIAQQARKYGLKTQVPILITPGSEQIRATIERDGQISALQAIGADVLANACGPCIGQWKRPEIKKDQPNSIITSFNRNFPGRNDGSHSTMNFIASPEIVIAFALGGKLSFNPLKDYLTSPDGSKFKLEPPVNCSELPKSGFADIEGVYVPPPVNHTDINITVDDNSERLKILQPFEKWNGSDLSDCKILIKTKGQCTTDQISPAGKWLFYRGHIDNISKNLLLGAVNYYNDKVGVAKNFVTKDVEEIPKVAKYYKENKIPWVIIGDDNYGEGSSREHAAMTPRHLGCVAVIAKSFARIHETNLKKQGVLALTFENPQDYYKILEDDVVTISGLENFGTNSSVTCEILHSDGGKEKTSLRHSYNDHQTNWFISGSALNTIDLI